MALSKQAMQGDPCVGDRGEHYTVRPILYPSLARYKMRARPPESQKFHPHTKLEGEQGREA